MKKPLIIVSLLLSLFAVSCGNDAKDPALDLLAKAQEECEVGNYNNARILIDSLSITYPESYKVRREAEILRRQVMIKEKERDAQYYDSEVTRLSAIRDSLATGFTFNKNPRYQDTGYYTHPSQSLSVNATNTFLRASVNEDGTAFVASFYRGRKIDHTTLKVSVGANYVVCEKPYSSRSYREYGVYSERCDYKYGEDCGIIDFVMLSSGPFVVELSGTGGTFSYTLRESDVEAIRSVSQFALLLREIERMREFRDDAAVSFQILQEHQKISEGAAVDNTQE